MMGNIFIDKYAKFIGPIATAIYLCLRRHANYETRIAFPSHRHIAEELNINERTVLRYIPTLKAHRFITIEKTRYKGRWEHNRYYLTYSRDWLTEPCHLKSHGDQTTNSQSPDDKKYKNYVTADHTNNTNNKKTKEEIDVINKNKEIKYEKSELAKKIGIGIYKNGP